MIFKHTTAFIDDPELWSVCSHVLMLVKYSRASYSRCWLIKRCMKCAKILVTHLAVIVGVSKYNTRLPGRKYWDCFLQQTLSLCDDKCFFFFNRLLMCRNNCVIHHTRDHPYVNVPELIAFLKSHWSGLVLYGLLNFENIYFKQRAVHLCLEPLLINDVCHLVYNMEQFVCRIILKLTKFVRKKTQTWQNHFSRPVKKWMYTKRTVNFVVN